ncbi:hypothetical protein RB653_002989 [Dictyostelium firmibasis]|uniref:RRM domain-containing protein n=1 Tax=Dictyostelium firmibasis TaxID=79012 RepID=A0AAN7TYI3_9MYCE
MTDNNNNNSDVIEDNEELKGENINNQNHNNIGNNTEDSSFEDPELEEMKKRFREMEEEAKKLTELQNNLESNITGNSNVGISGNMGGGSMINTDQEEIDSRSVYVGNVDYKSTHDQILAYFQSCGTVNRITILSDKTTGHPKGCCYVEFVNKESIINAMALNDSFFNERQLKITPKRTNLPYYMRQGVLPPGRGGFRGGRGRGGIRGGIRGGRGRGNFYQPY